MNLGVESIDPRKLSEKDLKELNQYYFEIMNTEMRLEFNEIMAPSEFKLSPLLDSLSE
jgi:hypothetical protein